MKRNSKTEREKYLRRVKEQSREVWQEAREMEWVPVEESQFLGWELTLDLQPGAKFRRDALTLLRVLRVLNAEKPTTTRKEEVVRTIRSQGRLYNQALQEYQKKFRRKNWRGEEIVDYRDFPLFYERSISIQDWEKLSTDVQKYFYKTKRSWWSPDEERYMIYKLDRISFPTYELIIKIDRAYTTHRGIPNSEALSKYDELESIIDNEYSLWSHGSRQSFYHKYTNRTQRKAWKMATKGILRDADHDNIEEVIEQQEFYAIGRKARD